MVAYAEVSCFKVWRVMVCVVVIYTNLISITLQFIMKFIYASAAILASSIATVSGQSTVGNWDITYNNTETNVSLSQSLHYPTLIISTSYSNFFAYLIFLMPTYS